MKDIDILIGSTIVSAKQLDESHMRIICADGRKFSILVDDDGCGGNDSHAYFDGWNLSPIIGWPITDACHKGKDSYGVLLVLKSGELTGTIQITHDHNGYYGFCYEVVEETDKS